MTNKLLLILLILCSIKASGQMDFQDSTAQVITYWDLGEKYEYAVTFQQLSYSEKDTTKNETMTYDVEVTVIDSTENNYVVKWFYKNIETNSKNPLIQKLVKASEDIEVDIKLDALGVIQEVVNWEEVRDYMVKSIGEMKSDLPEIPEIEKMFQQIESTYSSKASIEAAAIQDVQQFHNFHGGKYPLNEKLTGQIKTPNIYYPEKPFDTNLIVILEELDEENSQFRIRSIHEVDTEQLTQSAFQYVSELFSNLNQKIPKREEFENLTNSVETVSRIHNTGWVLESILWKEVFVDGLTNMEIRTIQMK